MSKYTLHALLTALLLFLSAAAHAQLPTRIENLFDTTQGIHAGIALQGGNASDGTNTASGYDLSTITVDIHTTGLGITTAIVASDTDEDFKLNGLTMAGDSTDTMFGFLYVNDVYDAFDGTISAVEKNISVDNSASSAIGVAFLDIKEFDGTTGQKWGGLNTATISLGNITVKGNGAEGFAAAGVTDGKITLEDVNVDGGEERAKGIFLQGDVDTDVNVNNITVKGGDAFGIQIGNLFEEADGNFIDGNINVDGAIKADATGRAYGIQVAGDVDGDVTVKGGITVTGEAAVDSGTSDPAPAAVGFYAAETVTGTLKLGNISATAGDGNGLGIAHGFSAKEVDGGNITLGTLTVTGEDGAVGVNIGNGGYNGVLTTGVTTVYGSGAVTEGEELNSGSQMTAGIAVDGDFVLNSGSSLGNITTVAKTSGNVYGIMTTGTENTFTANEISAGNNGTGDAVGIGLLGSGTDTSVSVGKVAALSSDTGQAYGVLMDGEGKLTLRADISAKGGGANTSGIRLTDDATLTLGANVTITAEHTGTGDWTGADIWSSGDLDMSLGSSRTLTTSKVIVDDGKYLSLTGTGTADFGVVTIEGGDLTIGTTSGTASATKVKLDIYQSDLGEGDKTVNSGGSLMVNSEAEESELEGFQYDFSDWTLGTGETNDYTRINYTSDPLYFWNLDTTSGILSYGGKKIYNMGEGFLAAIGMHGHYTAWNAVRDQMISGNGFGFRANQHGDETCPSCGGYHTRDNGYCDCSIRNTWVNYIERHGSVYHRDWNRSLMGAQAGTDILRSNNGQLGVFFGYEEGKLTNTTERIDATDLYVGIYAAYILRNGADIRAVFAGGWQDFETYRLLNDNSEYRYSSAFEGNTTETTIEIGKRVSDGTWSMRPVAGLDILTNKLDKTLETLTTTTSEDAFTYRKTDITQVYARLGSDMKYQRGKITLNSGFYYSYDMNGSTLDTLVWKEIGETEEETPPTRQYGSNLGRSLLNFNLGGSWQLASGFSMTMGYQGEYALDGDNRSLHHTSHLGGLWRW